MVAVSIFFVFAVFCFCLPISAEAGEVRTQVSQLVQPRIHEFTSTAGPSKTVLEEGGTNPLQNSILHLPTKTPDTFSAGTPRQGEGRRFKRGVLRRLALPLLILLGVKAGLALPLIFGGVALAAFKGLWTGSSALLMTSAMALKNLIPPPKIIVPGGGAHVHDIIGDYRRADPYYRDDYSRYPSGYGYRK